MAKLRNSAKRNLPPGTRERLKRQLDSGTSLENKEVHLRMLVMKPIHAGWLLALYDPLTGAEGRKCILSFVSQGNCQTRQTTETC